MIGEKTVSRFVWQSYSRADFLNNSAAFSKNGIPTIGFWLAPSTKWNENYFCEWVSWLTAYGVLFKKK